MGKINVFRRLRRGALLLFCALGAINAQAQTRSITQKLSQISGLIFRELPAAEVPNPQPGYRVFELQFMQPADHTNVANSYFRQKLILWHKDEARPMVLQTSGYSIFSVGLSALAMEFNANQIQVEHRFFSTSIPANPDWSLMNIEQSAADFHKITVALKTIYGAKWVNTGRSKGGMTSVYHRRFYPGDLDGTVAHVAPMSYSTADDRFVTYMDNIGGPANADCRAKLTAVQRKLLEHQACIMPELTGDYTQLGSKEIAYEHAVIELPWAYWQYLGPAADCANVPAADASLATLKEFFIKANDPSGYNDVALGAFVPYYYQAATQLGNPGTRLDEIVDLLAFPESFNIFSYVPQGVTAIYDNAAAMTDVAQWIANSSQSMMYIYGEWDPWSGGPFVPRPNSDSHLLYVPQKNHSAQFINLEGQDRTLAYERIQAWMGVPGEVAASTRKSLRPTKTLEELEFEAIRSRRL